MIGVIESRPYAAWTKADYRLFCKRFYRWLRGTEDYPAEVRWIKARVEGVHRKVPEELLTDTEVQRMVERADFGRDRALILALYESGCRIGEIGQLLIRHVQFDLHGAILIVSGKTGMRRIRIVKAVRLLQKWLAVHPLREEPDAPLWIGLRGRNRYRFLTRDAIARILERAARRADIKKRVHPHLFRHSRATDLAARLTEAQLKEVFGWAPGSAQAATYVHLSGRNVDEAVLRTYTRDTGRLGGTSPLARPHDALLDSLQVLAQLLRDGATLRYLARRARQLGLQPGVEVVSPRDSRPAASGR